MGTEDRDKLGDLDARWREKKAETLRQARSNYLKKHFEEKEKGIFEIIQASGIKGGISHNRLAFVADLDRKALRPYTKSLIKKGLVKKGEGLHGKYLPAQESYKDPLLSATLFGEDFRWKMLQKEDLITTTKVQDYPVFVDYFGIYSKYFEPRFTSKHRIERMIFEFSNRIGAFITYSLIQAMNPVNNDSTLPPRDQDRIAKEWVRKAIEAVMPYLVSQFRDSIYKGIDKYPSGYKAGVWYMKQGPKFVFEEKIVNRLLKAFDNLYPLIGQLFKETIKDLPRLLELHKKELENMYQRWEEQQACQHNYGKPTMTIFGYYGKQCSKCHYIKKIKSVYE